MSAHRGWNYDMTTENNPLGNVLVIEDNSELTVVLRQLIEYVGYQVFCAGDGESAWRLIQSHTVIPDAILCDLELPDMHGLVFLERVRHDGMFGDTYFVIMSGHVGEEEKRAMAAGANAYLKKPFDLETLERILRAQRDAR